jgi:hypothetical protein
LMIGLLMQWWTSFSRITKVGASFLAGSTAYGMKPELEDGVIWLWFVLLWIMWKLKLHVVCEGHRITSNYFAGYHKYIRRFGNGKYCTWDFIF